MRDRIQRTTRASGEKSNPRSPGFWGWLKQDGNQKTLRFAGAAIAAAVALLVSFGVIHKPPPEVASQTPTVSPSQSPGTAPSQTANASGGMAVNVQGSGNTVQAGKP